MKHQNGKVGAWEIIDKETLTVKFGLPENLCLANEHILHGVGASGLLLNIARDTPGHPAEYQRNMVTKIYVYADLESHILHLHALANFFKLILFFLFDNVDHLLADFADLRSLCVGGLRDLRTPSLRKSNAEKPEHVAVSGPDVYPRLDEGVPLLDQRADFVARQVHAVEVGQDLVALTKKTKKC